MRALVVANLVLSGTALAEQPAEYVPAPASEIPVVTEKARSTWRMRMTFRSCFAISLLLLSTGCFLGSEDDGYAELGQTRFEGSTLPVFDGQDRPIIGSTMGVRRWSSENKQWEVLGTGLAEHPPSDYLESRPLAVWRPAIDPAGNLYAFGGPAGTPQLNRLAVGGAQWERFDQGLPQTYPSITIDQVVGDTDGNLYLSGGESNEPVAYQRRRGATGWSRLVFVAGEVTAYGVTIIPDGAGNLYFNRHHGVQPRDVWRLSAGSTTPVKILGPDNGVGVADRKGNLYGYFSGKNGRLAPGETTPSPLPETPEGWRYTGSIIAGPLVERIDAAGALYAQAKEGPYSDVQIFKLAPGSGAWTRIGPELGEPLAWTISPKGRLYTRTPYGVYAFGS
ncbi:hypothetical protein ATI61_11896 [Archangium gephyra]|nr:hypothetical protein [Archangium gephyra]REG22891.1 hypothetical protein ATI61_11896 [Archangium gephyra]